MLTTVIDFSAFCRKHERALVLILLGIGFALRFAFIGSIPGGLNQDEASAGYDAWSILHYGIDRNGSSFPVLLIAWGSGQNVLYSYLSIPWIALFGLSVTSLRLTAALCGSLSLYLFYDMARRVRSRGFSLWALAALAVNPWHMMLSRWALESNLLPFCLLSAIWCLVRAKDSPRWLLGAGTAFAMALYAYGTAFFFLLFFLPPALLLAWRGEKLPARWIIAAGLVFIAMAFPITLCNLRNTLGLDGETVLGITLPKLTETRQSAVSVLGDGGFSTAFGNFRSFLRLLWTQNDGLAWNYNGSFGLFFGKPALLLCAAGLISRLRALFRKELPAGEGYILLMLFAAFCSAFFIDINVNRMNMAFLPLIWLQAEGLQLLGSALRPARLSFLPAAALLCVAVFSVRFYFTVQSKTIAGCFYEGLGEVIEYAANTADSDEPLWVSYEVNMPYIYVLFYEQIPPEDYLASVEYMNPGGAFQWVSSFSRWEFGHEPPRDGTICVLPVNEVSDMEVLFVSGDWAAARVG